MRVLPSLLLVAVASCTAPRHMAPARSEAPPDPKTSQGVSYIQAQRIARTSLDIGLTRSEVGELIGPPDETSVTTYGGDPGVDRWTGLAWTYRWKVNYGTKRLKIVFIRVIEDWEVNHWDWYDY